MNEQIYSLKVKDQDDAQNIVLFQALRSGHIIAVEKAVQNRSANTVGASTIDVDIGNDGTEELNNICAGSETGDVFSWVSTHLGGEHPPVPFEKGQEVAIDIDHAGAGTVEMSIHVHVAYGRA